MFVAEQVHLDRIKAKMASRSIEILDIDALSFFFGTHGLAARSMKGSFRATPGVILFFRPSFSQLSLPTATVAGLIDIDLANSRRPH